MFWIFFFSHDSAENISHKRTCWDIARSAFPHRKCTEPSSNFPSHVNRCLFEKKKLWLFWSLTSVGLYFPQSLYKKEGLEFLLDVGDTVHAYEERGRSRDPGLSEQELEQSALSQMNHVQKIEVMQGQCGCLPRFMAISSWKCRIKQLCSVAVCFAWVSNMDAFLASGWNHF